MLQRCKDRPECFDNILDDSNFMFIRAYDDKGTYGYLGLGFLAPKMAFVHVHLTRFGPSVLIKAKNDWHHIVQALKNDGIELLSTQQLGTKEDHATWIKFIRHCGFTEVDQFISATMRI